MTEIEMEKAMDKLIEENSRLRAENERFKARLRPIEEVWDHQVDYDDGADLYCIYYQAVKKCMER